ncbi:MAG: viroplasmin family protein [Veillonella sp.]|nr:viroplasmin family protein [Veillonella sp.]
MAKKYYAVRQGRVPGVYTTWADCEKQVKGFGGAIYKSFPTEAEARAFVEDSGLSLSDFMSAHKGESKSLQGTKKITTKVSSGIQNKVSAGEAKPDFTHRNHVVAYIDGSYNKLLAAMYVMKYAVDHGIPECSLYYDYMGIEMWATKRWKRNNALTQQYAAFYDSIKNRVRVHFHKVAAHTGDTYNEMADALAKQGAGI